MTMSYNHVRSRSLGGLEGSFLRIFKAKKSSWKQTAETKAAEIANRATNWSNCWEEKENAIEHSRSSK